VLKLLRLFNGDILLFFLLLCLIVLVLVHLESRLTVVICLLNEVVSCFNWHLLLLLFSIEDTTNSTTSLFNDNPVTCDVLVERLEVRAVVSNSLRGYFSSHLSESVGILRSISISKHRLLRRNL
jgi:uncharacterized membrane protein YeiB